MAKRPAGIRAFLRTFATYDLDRAALAEFDRPVYFALGGLSDVKLGRISSPPSDLAFGPGTLARTCLLLGLPVPEAKESEGGLRRAYRRRTPAEVRTEAAHTRVVPSRNNADWSLREGEPAKTAHPRTHIQPLALRVRTRRVARGPLTAVQPGPNLIQF